MKRTLKLFIWEGFCPDYSGGLAVALAHDETEARALITADYGKVYDWGTLTVHPLTKPMATCVSGGS
jgi:hypothetical protein